MPAYKKSSPWDWWSPYTLGQGVGGSLLNLFRNGEDGFLFWPQSDLTRQFLLSTGATGNAAADADPVGLDLDNHSWGNGVSLASVLAAQTELLIPGSWTMSVAGGTSTATESPAGTLNLTGDGANSARGDQSFTTVVGKTYRVHFTVANLNCVCSAGTVIGGSSLGSLTTSGVGTFDLYFVATTTTSWVRFSKTTGLTVISAISCKLVPGNHALQATTTKRPLWKANSGKPYLSFDGTDDGLVSPFIPTAACTLAIAGRFGASPAAAQVMIGGGSSATNKRASIGHAVAGVPFIGWGGESGNVAGAPSISNGDHIIVLSGDASTREVWVDGVQVNIAASNGSPDGTGGGEALGIYNNNGSLSLPFTGGEYAALALNRRVTPSEIAMITSNFRSTYQ